MSHEQTIPTDHWYIIDQVNQIAASPTLGELLDLVLGLVIELTGSSAAVCYLHRESDHRLVLEAGKGDPRPTSVERVLAPDTGLVGEALRQRRTIDRYVAPPSVISSTSRAPHCCIPLFQGNQTVGVILTFPPPQSTARKFSVDILAQLDLLALLIAPHICRIRQLADAQRREQRFKDLITIISFMSTMLDRGQLLDDIMAYIQDLLQVEATSIWIKDDRTGELVLHVATGERSERIREIRVPADHGIIGNVIRTGQSVIVDDVSRDTHFYAGVDQLSGFKTRSILCVPLRAPRIQLGNQHGALRETIIGGAQALNKRDGSSFSEEDILLMELLAGQAAVILQLSELYTRLSGLNEELTQAYNETRKMFRGFINGITSFIDRKDPYTSGHSQRVSEFAVAIARQLDRNHIVEISEEMLDHIRIGGILHDVGKIGVPDEILKKPSQLNDEEIEQMRMHPIYGIELLRDSDLLRLLPNERQAIEEHHERLDGSGYPRGLRGIRNDDILFLKTKGSASDNVNHTVPLDESNVAYTEGISLIGRIVAVADAFDAMTSDRPYRASISAEEAIEILREASGKEFDAMCVEALVQARQHGMIQTQSERHTLEKQQSMGREQEKQSCHEGEPGVTTD